MTHHRRRGCRASASCSSSSAWPAARTSTRASSATPRLPRATQNADRRISASAGQRPMRWPSLDRVVEKRDFGSSLARELARADLALKPSEFLAIRFAATVGVPLVMIVLSPLVSLFSSPILLAWSARRRLTGSRLLAQPPQVEAPQGVQRRAGRHDHAARQLAARWLIVPAVGRDGRVARHSRPSRRSSRASFARSTLACRSTMRWPTWAAA